MGKETRNFRQTKKARSADYSARNFANINRNPWHMKIINFIKVRGKGNY